MPNMNLEMSDLRAFVAVAELGTFSAAAHDLHLSQPALSRRISKLEAKLGVRLLERTTRRVDLTAFGRDFARKARDILNSLDESLLGLGEVAGRMNGEVTVACVPSVVRYFLPQVLRAFHEKYPRILIRVMDEGASEVLSSVVRSEADFGLNYIGVQEANIEFQPVLKEAFVVACRRDHALAGRAHVSWSELGQYDYMSVAKASGNRFLLDLALADSPDLPRAFCEVRHVMSVVSLVEAGVGIAAVPRLAMPDDDHPLLVSVPLVDPVVSRTVGLIRRRGRVLSAAAQQLYDLISEKSAS
ncbi:DNA-binding transcriptional LysR family regulator [Pseudomonas sp. JUb42]|jgi:DNA-binding transcriptional LysR family regulator|uniref:LysR family transcriptional regulator n=1 Tax=Pseudomonas sp. JUb42 TaxID=2940611 RepID=UPI002168411F|nr:LysR family transcriptional regulator [Pseudomonas sp. JUb42]MCS3470412.1 DNA-binding transcriptional LysR family regulator [Pseudomonas sp. JUb42]